MKIKGVGEDNFDAFILLKYITVSSDPSLSLKYTSPDKKKLFLHSLFTFRIIVHISDNQCVVYITSLHVRLSLIHTSTVHYYPQLKLHFVSILLKSAQK